MPLSHEQRTEAAGLIVGLAIVTLLAVAVAIQAGWFGLQPAPAARSQPFGPGAQVENAGAIWRVDRVSWNMGSPPPVATVILRAMRGQSPGALTTAAALAACRSILGQGLTPPGGERPGTLVTNWTLRLTYMSRDLRHLATFEMPVVDYRLRAQYCRAGTRQGGQADQAARPQLLGQEFAQAGARWRVGQINWDLSGARPELTTMVWQQGGQLRLPVGPELARDICGVLLRLKVQETRPDRATQTAARARRPWTMRLRLRDAAGREAGPFPFGVAQTPTGSPTCFPVAAQPRAQSAPEHPISFVLPMPISENWIVTVLLAHPGTGKAPVPPGVDEAFGVCEEILAALPSPLAPGMTAANVSSFLVSYRYGNGKGESGPSRKIRVVDGTCEGQGSSVGPASEGQVADAVQAPPGSPPLTTYRAAGARWPLVAVDWRQSDQGQNGQGWTLLASFGPGVVPGSDAPEYGLLSYQAAALCRAILAHPLSRVPEGVQARDVARLGLRVARPQAAGQDGQGGQAGTTVFGGWVFRTLWRTDCDGARPDAAPGQEVLETSAINRHVVARGAVVNFDRETWLRQGGTAGAAGAGGGRVTLRLHVASLTPRSGDRPVALTGLLRWTLCNSVLATLPIRTRTGLTRQDIAAVSFRVDGRADTKDLTQAVRDGICVLPQGARIGSE
ncbi:MAG TPA: hypothetical protein ENJ52_11365 [Aliiroseovarius sp.]|nr:hypothetical protein [Aliiroseovarius sp.]